MHILVKTKWNSLQIWHNQFFSRSRSISPQRHQISDIFGPSTPTMRGLHVLLNYPYSNIQKMVCSKRFYCRTTLGNICSWRIHGTLFGSTAFQNKIWDYFNQGAVFCIWHYENLYDSIIQFCNFFRAVFTIFGCFTLVRQHPIKSL